MENVRITNTPYDDVFRTLLNDCSSLIIPVINEVFGEHYSTGYGIHHHRVYLLSSHFLWLFAPSIIFYHIVQIYSIRKRLVLK